jgi:hypothetical protein
MLRRRDAVAAGGFVMARSLLNHSVLIALGLGFAGAIGCSGGGTTGTTGSGGGGTGGTVGSGGTTSSATTATSAVSSSADSSSAVSSSAATGGSGGMGSTSATGTGGMGTGGAAASSSATSSGTGGNPNDVDNDGDGWTVNEGDCCDTTGNCGTPELVNPGAFEYLGNGVDDDCDASTLDNVVPADCAPPALTVPTSSDDLIKAMDLCQFTTASPPKPMKKWGVIHTDLLLADGTNAVAPKDLQVGVLDNYGTNVVPRKGPTMAAISSGTARDSSDPGYVHPQNGSLMGQSGTYNANTQVGVPAPWLAAHNGVVPSPGNCPVCTGANCAQAFDSVNLKAQIRVPTNAKSFSYSFKFYTAEYPEFVCQQFNDFFLTLLKSSWTPAPVKACMKDSECESSQCVANMCVKAAPLPADSNISFDGQKNAVSVNNGFFEVCFPAVNAPAGACPSGTFDLVGTGMGGWGNNLKDGGGTEWLINDAPVVPGETMEIQFVTWDAGDHNVDSLVLLDKFRWNVTASTTGVHH